MSFICQGCNKPQIQGTKPIRRVVEKRDKNYLGGGQGWEIVREENLCKPCDETRRGRN